MTNHIALAAAQAACAINGCTCTPHIELTEPQPGIIHAEIAHDTNCPLLDRQARRHPGTPEQVVTADPKVWGHVPGPHEVGCAATPKALGGAVCGLVHDRCSAHQKGTGLPCGRYPKGAAKSCRSHGGEAGQVQRAARRRQALGQAEVAVALERDRRIQLGGVLPVDNAEALAELVSEAAFNVAVYRHLVQQLEAGRIDELADDEDGFPAVGLGSTLAVRTGSSTKANEAAPHVWLTLYDEERERLARWSKMAIDAGVSERRVQVVEDQARMLAGAMSGLAAALLELVLDVVGSAADRGRVRAVWGERWAGLAREQLAALDTTEGNPT